MASVLVLNGDILEFSGDHRWLSNFGEGWCYYKGKPFKYRENAYQWAKLADNAQESLYLQYANIDPKAAKRLSKGHKYLLREDLFAQHDNRARIMATILRDAFSRDPLRSQLLATKGLRLVEGNWWGDEYFGVCNGVRCKDAPHKPRGENYLGRILMKIRGELSEDGRSGLVDTSV